MSLSQLFQRRIFSLTSATSDVVLVHYLNVQSIPLTRNLLGIERHAGMASDEYDPDLPVFDEFAASRASPPAPAPAPPLLPPVPTSGDPHATSPALDEPAVLAPVTAFAVQDYAPAWSLPAGGEPVLICVQPPLPELPQSATWCWFGSSRVTGDWLAANVVKCRGE